MFFISFHFSFRYFRAPRWWLAMVDIVVSGGSHNQKASHRYKGTRRQESFFSLFNLPLSICEMLAFILFVVFHFQRSSFYIAEILLRKWEQNTDV